MTLEELWETTFTDFPEMKTEDCKLAFMSGAGAMAVRMHGALLVLNSKLDFADALAPYIIETANFVSQGVEKKKVKIG